MGCGESKLAVATSNTILRRKKSSVGGSSSKTSKDIETILENFDKSTANGANSTVQQQQQQTRDQIKGSEHIKEDKINDNVGGGETSVAADLNVEDIKVNSKDGDDDDGKEILDKGNKEEHDEAAERSITHGSPNRFFSSRKLEEEGIDGIISEGRSGTSDYYTPRHGSKGNLHFKVDDDIAEDDKELALPAETNAPAETEKNEELVKPEENLVKEAEVATTTTVEAKVVEDKGSVPAEEEKKN